jgi:hypothetical protein
MELRFRIYDKKTLEDITDEYKWIITSEGKLYYLEYSDLIYYPGAYYELIVKRNGTWERV